MTWFLGIIIATIAFWMGEFRGKWKERDQLEEHMMWGTCATCKQTWLLWERDESERCPRDGGELHYRDRVILHPHQRLQMPKPRVFG